MVSPQNFSQFIYCLIGIGLTQGRTYNHLQMRDSQNTFLNSRIGSQNQVVLIHTHTVVTFAHQHPDNTERNGSETDHFTYRIFTIREKFIHYGLTHHTHLGGCFNIVFGEEVPIFQLIAANIQIVLIHPINSSRSIVSSENHLSRTVHHRRDITDISGLFLNILQVLEFQRLHIV